MMENIEDKGYERAKLAFKILGYEPGSDDLPGWVLAMFSDDEATADAARRFTKKMLSGSIIMSKKSTP